MKRVAESGCALGAGRDGQGDGEKGASTGGGVTAPPWTRTQAPVRRPDRLRPSGLPQGCSRCPPHRRESRDFTPAGTRAERVQTVNDPAQVVLERGYFYFSAARARSSTLTRRSAATKLRSASASAGRMTSLTRPEIGSGISSSPARLAARRMSSAEIRL